LSGKTLAVVVILLVALGILMPAETAFWLSLLGQIFVPSPACIINALPWIALWACLMVFATVAHDRWKARWADALSVILILSAPFFLNADLVQSSLYTVRALHFEQINYSAVGFWRFLLMTTAAAVLFASTPFEEKWYVTWVESLMSVLFYALFCVAVGAAMISFKPPMDSQLWIGARWALLTGTYMIASLFNLFAPFAPLAKEVSNSWAAVPFIILAASTCMTAYAAHKKDALGDWFKSLIKPRKPAEPRGIERLPASPPCVMPAAPQSNISENRRAGEAKPAWGEAKPAWGEAKPAWGEAKPAWTKSAYAKGEGGAKGEGRVEDPSPFNFFCADNGRQAREAANRKGLVALYYGNARWDSSGGKHEFFAISEDLATRLLNGEAITAEERRALAKWIWRGEITVSSSAGADLAKVASERLSMDIKRQLERINALREDAYRKVASRKPDYVA